METKRLEELRIGSWNVQRGLNVREAEIRAIANQLDIFVLTETDTSSLTYNIPGFKTFFPDMEASHKSRVLILMKDWLVPHVQTREDLMNCNFSSIWIRFSPSIFGKTFNLCAIYREWSFNGENSHNSQLGRIDTFMNQVEKATKGSEGIIILGDINLCSKKWDEPNYTHKTLSDRWREGMARSGMEMLDLGSTYFSNHASQKGVFAESALDHIYTNCPEKVLDFRVLEDSGTDHLPIFSKFQTNRKPEGTILYKRSYKNFNSKAFCRDLAMAPWEDIWNAGDVSTVTLLMGH